MSTSTQDTTTQDTTQQIDAACALIAPTWPLDRFIAVNPYWGWVDRPIGEAAATLGALCGTRLTMDRSWFATERDAGRLDPTHLQGSAAAVLETAEGPRTRLALVTDLRDAGSGAGPGAGRTWPELVTHQISQHCAAFFDEHQSSWHLDRGLGLFGSWREHLAGDRGVDWRHGHAWVRAQLSTLPADSTTAIEETLSALMIPESGRVHYLAALLLSINGWAAWCAHERWQARLIGTDDASIVDLLAIRLSWEWLLMSDLDAADGPADVAAWSTSWGRVDEIVAGIVAQQHVDWELQDALERTYQQGLVDGLSSAPPGSAGTVGEPAVQAVFCIDVRSEVLRRAVESVTPQVHTRGFAGFFGLPISYSPAGTDLARPQLPGLLAPALAVDETSTAGALATQNAAEERTTTLADRKRWSAFKSSPSSVFGFVESMGLSFGPRLLAGSVPSLRAQTGSSRWEDDGLPAGTASTLRPHLALIDEDPAAAAEIGHRVLRGMGLTSGFAPLVLLCGHGSHTTNNPHAAGLDCGACGGQTGEVNARVLAQLLNAAPVRQELRHRGIDIGPETWFLPGLHVTTVDDVRLFDLASVPATHTGLVSQLRTWLDEAARHARAERATALGLEQLIGRPDALEREVRERAEDWSQVRPEWGLTGNAAFVVAPRARTRHLDLAGRVFLHDYDWRDDADLGVLTLIMTAPMVVTNWINMQYLASTVDNHRYGSGNKVLHNVVGGRIGVFEGNGGDLRIGLPMQSLHDGVRLMHAPLRLSVFIEAPRDAIDQVIGAQTVVRHLVANGWLHLLRIEPSTGAVERWTTEGWAQAT